MLKPSALPSSPHQTHISLLQTCQTHQQLKQIHSSTIKQGTFNHTSINSKLLSLYSDPKIGNLEYVQSVFDHIEDPSSFSWNTIIKCYIDHHRSHEGILMFCKLLKQSDHPPDNFTYSCVIKGCARLSAVKEGKQIHGLVLKTGFGEYPYVECSLVSLYAKCEDVESARKVFDRMGDRNLVSWNSLMDGYVRTGDVESAQRLFDEMSERDCFTWTVLIDGYSKCGKVEVARELFDRMENRSLVTWNAMINGYMKSRDFGSAKELFETMGTRNVVTWNSMIAGYEWNEKYMEALEIFHKMLEVGPKPNVSTLVSTLSAVSGLALLEEGSWIHTYMDQNGFKLDGILGTALIEMYSKCGSIEKALDVFRAIPKKKLGHWTAIIVGLGIHGLADHALELFSNMQRLGLKPNQITFIGVLNSCSHAGLINEGYQYFELMRNKYGIEPMIEHYGCLVDLLCRAGRVEEAMNVIEKMPMKPNKVIWMSLLSGCRKPGNIEIAEVAAMHIMQLAPDAIGSYVLLSNIYASAGQWEKVSAVREMMKERGARKDPGCSVIEHDNIIHEFIVGDSSHPQAEAIYAKVIEVTERLKHGGYVPDTTQVLLCIEGEKEKEAELANHSERLAIAFGLLNVKPGRPIRIMKNLRVCNDCHTFTKMLSRIYDREIIVRDKSRFHHFKDGACSCLDYW